MVKGSQKTNICILTKAFQFRSWKTVLTFMNIRFSRTDVTQDNNNLPAIVRHLTVSAVHSLECEMVAE